MSDDVFYHVGMIMNVDPTEVAKIIHDYIERDTGNGYDRFNSPPPPIYIGPAKCKLLKERLEEAMMKATSVQNIKNVKDVCFSIDNHPAEIESKLTIVASTNDDIFAFEFEGEHLIQSCKRAGLFTGWEKDQKIRELEKENKELKAKSKDISDDNALLLETNKKLREENEKLKDKLENVEPFRSLERTIKEKQQLKEEYEEKIDVLQRKYSQAIDRISELEELKTPTIENFEEPSTRADILDQAKKCVCGQREQDYGTPESNFQLIADLWNGYLGTKYRYVDDVKPINIAPLKPLDVSMMMALLKIARIKNGGGSGDSFVDLAGYAACGGEIWHMQNHKDQK